MTAHDPFLLRNVVARAAKLRAAHYGSSARLLDWPKLTDAQKVRWLVKAHNELSGNA